MAVATLAVLLVVVIFAGVQGVVLSIVINTLRVDTYIAPIVGLEIVFLLISLVWIPIWVLLAYNKRK